ncbi:8409_t:CDS:2, partial [Racocetra persica]
LSLVQTIPISTSNYEIEVTSDDLLYMSPLLLFSVSIIPNLYFFNNEFGRESFMLTKKLYNSVTEYKNIESENYAGHEQTSNNSNKGKPKAQNDLNNYFKSIKEKYTKLNSSFSRKRQRPNLLPSSSSKAKKTNLQNNNSTSQTDNSLTNNFFKP